VAVRLLDTNIVSFLVKRHPLAARYRPHLTGYTLAVSFMTLGELEEGMLRAGWGPARRARLGTMLRSYVILHSDLALCTRWAEVRVQRRHRPIDSTDAWIAATALTHGLKLITHNPADFRGIPGLTVITEAP
jgi:predicted nucleic acid-binding protein